MVVYPQSVLQLESELKDRPISNLKETRRIAKQLIKLDKYNETGIFYLIATFYPLKDSISTFFDNLIESDPNNPKPYILRAKFENFNQYTSDSNNVTFLKKAIQLDEDNEEANYLLGILYYSMFIENNKQKSVGSKTYYAQNSKLYLTKSSIERAKFPLIQISNYLNDKSIYLNFSVSSNSQEYFPTQLFANLPDQWETNYKFDVIEALDRGEFYVSWYSKHLKALQEPILYNQSNGERVFRFTWLRSFHNPIAIRIEKNDEKVMLYWKLTDGEGGYEPGKLLIDKSKELSIVEWNKFNTQLEKLNYWNLKTKDEEALGVDGAQWILEGIKKDTYQVVDRWTSESDFKECCLYLLSLTDLNITEEEIY
jgi:hypothetical protein